MVLELGSKGAARGTNASAGSDEFNPQLEMIILDQALQLAANVAGAIKELFNFQSKKLDLRNTEKIQANVEAQREAAAADKTREAIAKGDIEEIRKELSE